MGGIGLNILVIAAHPDDEILGVGGTILKHIAAGHEVRVCVVTKAYEPDWSSEYISTKLEEQKKVDDILGIKKRYNLDFPTVKLNTIPHGEFNKSISKVVEDANPDIIYTHFEHDLNYDHTLIFRAAIVASRPPKNIKLVCFETLSETEWGTKSFSPNLWIDITDYIDKKIEALNIYESEIKEEPHPRSIDGVTILAKKRGGEISKKYAEAFLIIREIWC